MPDRPPSPRESSPAMSAVEQIVDVALFAPFTLSAKLIEEIPVVVSRARQHLLLARFMGKLAVKQGTEEVRRRLEGDRAAPEPNESPVDDDGVVASVAAAPTAPVDPSVPVAGDLALPDYEHLPAAHVVSKLPTLSTAEWDLIEEYERAHRHRRTVLGKIDQLRAGST